MQYCNLVLKNILIYGPHAKCLQALYGKILENSIEIAANLSVQFIVK